MFAGYQIIVHDQRPQPGWKHPAVGRMSAAPGGFQCHGNSEGGTHALFTLNRNVAIHHRDNAFADRHTEARAAELVAGSLHLLGERLKDFGNVIPVHTDAGITDGEAKTAVVLKAAGLLHGEGDRTRRLRELHGVTQNVDQHLPELHLIADIVILGFPDDPALVLQSLVRALLAHHYIGLIQEFPEAELLIPQFHMP